MSPIMRNNQYDNEMTSHLPTAVTRKKNKVSLKDACTVGDAKRGSHCGKQDRCLTNLKRELPYGAAISSGYLSKENSQSKRHKHTCVC